MIIKIYTQDEQDNYKKQFPVSEPKQFALYDDEFDVVMGFFDTEDEAKEELEECRQRDLVEGALRDAVHKIADETGIDIQKVTKIASEFF